jgi:hypothetical protein
MKAAYLPGSIRLDSVIAGEYKARILVGLRLISLEAC